MDENLLELEHYLLSCLSNDQAEINAATEYISNIIQSENANSLFFGLISNSAEPNAIRQAAIQLSNIIKMSWDKYTIENIHDFGSQIMNFLNSSKYDAKTKQLLSNVLILIINNVKEPWQELFDFISNLNNEVTDIRLQIALNSIRLFNENDISTLIPIFQNSINFSFNSGKIELILSSMQLLIELLTINPEGFDQNLQIIPQIIPNLVNSNDTEQSIFFSLLSKIISLAPEVDGIIKTIIQFIQTDSSFPEVSIYAINSLSSYSHNFTEEQLDSVLEILIFQTVKLSETLNILPEDSSDFIESLLNEYHHNDVYSIIKAKLQECLTSENSLVIATGILLLSPILNSAPEVIVGDEMQFVLELLNLAISPENPIDVCKAGCRLVGYAYSIDPLCLYLIRYTESIVSLMISEDIELSHLASQALDWIFDVRQVVDESVVQFLFDSKENVQFNCLSRYLLTFHKAILSANHLSANLMQRVFDFTVENLNQTGNSEFVGISLNIFASLLSKDENYASYLENIVPFVQQCLESEEFDCFNALTFLGKISEILGVCGTEFLSLFIEKLEDIIKNRKIYRAMRFRASIKTLCKFIRYSEINVIEFTLKWLKKMIVSHIDHDINEGLLNLKIIVKSLDDQTKKRFYKIVLSTTMETDSQEILSSRLLVLPKFIKYPPQNYQEKMFQELSDFCYSFVEGNLECLGGKSFLNEMIFAPLVQDFANFVAVFCSKSNINCTEIAMLFSPLIEKNEEFYLSLLFSVFSGVLENETIDENFAQEICDYIPALFEKSVTINLQHDAIFMMNKLLVHFPQLYDDAKPLIVENALNWFNKAKSENSIFGKMLSNAASLFIHAATLDKTIDQQIIDQSLLFYPPEDETEFSDFTNYIFQLFEVSELSLDSKKNIATGLFTVITAQKYMMRKWHLSEEKFQILNQILRNLLEDETILSHMRSILQNDPSSLQKLEIFLSNSN